MRIHRLQLVATFILLQNTVGSGHSVDGTIGGGFAREVKICKIVLVVVDGHGVVGILAL